jgi:flagellar motor switch/type III secretory pathway protein FliN
MNASTFSLDNEIAKMTRDVENGGGEEAAQIEDINDAIEQPQPFKFVPFESTSQQNPPQSTSSKTLQIEIGRTRIPAGSQLTLESVVELSQSASEPVVILVDDKPIAHGELLVIANKLAIRITERLESAFDAV